VRNPRYRAAHEKQWAELTPRFHVLKWQIATTPARTPEGLRAMATAALTMICPEVDGTPSDDDALSASVLHDGLGLPPAEQDFQVTKRKVCPQGLPPFHHIPSSRGG